MTEDDFVKAVEKYADYSLIPDANLYGISSIDSVWSTVCVSAVNSILNSLFSVYLRPSRGQGNRRYNMLSNE